MLQFNYSLIEVFHNTETQSIFLVCLQKTSHLINGQHKGADYRHHVKVLKDGGRNVKS